MLQILVVIVTVSLLVDPPAHLSHGVAFRQRDRLNDLWAFALVCGDRAGFPVDVHDSAVHAMPAGIDIQHLRCLTGSIFKRADCHRVIQHITEQDSPILRLLYAGDIRPVEPLAVLGAHERGVDQDRLHA